MITDEQIEEFDKIEGLTWYPWIGNNFDQQNSKLLLIGESHYADDGEGNFDEECFHSFLNDKWTTASYIQNFTKNNRILGKDTWSLYENIYRALFRTTNIDVEKFWSKVAFYNFIQRPMKSISERPSNSDYRDSFNIFINLVKKISVTHCIFLGNSSQKYFSTIIQPDKSIEIRSEKYEQIGRYWASQ